ncbi:50S ribosomal protein L9 [bacterium]|nr:50S ribosomal protein L9 [bacterium]
MKIILVKDVEGLGNAGEILNVKDGYGRNYLVPRGFALVANESNVRELEFNRKRIDRMIDVERTAAQDLAAKLSAVDIQIERKFGEDGKLFGSVTNRDIAAVLEENGYTVNSHHIVIETPIKKTGIYQPEVKLFRDVRAVLKVLVVGEGGEMAPEPVATDEDAPVVEEEAPVEAPVEETAAE